MSLMNVTADHEHDLLLDGYVGFCGLVLRALFLWSIVCLSESFSSKKERHGTAEKRVHSCSQRNPCSGIGDKK